MLFSDGGTEEAWEVLEKYNYDKSVSITMYKLKIKFQYLEYFPGTSSLIGALALLNLKKVQFLTKYHRQSCKWNGN